MQALYHLILYFNLILYGSFAYLIFFDMQITGIKPLYWYVLTLASASAVFLLRARSVIQDMPWPFIGWMTLFSAYFLILFLYSSQSAMVIQEFIEYTQIIALLGAFLVLLLIRDAGRTVQRAMLVIALLGTVLNFIDFISPTWSAVPGRGAGFYENPNISGKILAFAMVASVTAVPKKFRLLYCCVIGAGIFITFSRGSWMLWGIAVMGLGALGKLSLPGRAIGFTLAGMFGGAFVYAASTGLLLDILGPLGLSDYLNVDTLERLGHGDSELQDHSFYSRLRVILSATQAFAEQPWFGAGLGYTQEWGTIKTHNMYLAMAVEGGMFGLAVFVTLLLVLWKYSNNMGRLMVILYVVSSLLTHNNLDQPAMLIFVAMIAVIYRRQHAETENKYLDHYMKTNPDARTQLKI